MLYRFASPRNLSDQYLRVYSECAIGLHDAQMRQSRLAAHHAGSRGAGVASSTDGGSPKRFACGVPAMKPFITNNAIAPAIGTTSSSAHHPDLSMSCSRFTVTASHDGDRAGDEHHCQRQIVVR